jgi:hypothetical protein
LGATPWLRRAWIASAGDDDLVPQVEELVREGETDACAAAGDEDGVTTQIHCNASISSSVAVVAC